MKKSMSRLTLCEYSLRVSFFRSATAISGDLTNHSFNFSQTSHRR